MALVLVLEDDAGLRFAFSEALEDAGHQVLPAADPDAAIAFLKRQVPDVLLLDLMIGGSYSTDVANYAAFAAPNAHVVYVTGSGLFPKGELFDMCQNARLILRKPVDLRELTDLVSHISAGATARSTASA
ncbi:MAG: response regulator [Pseudomonadota bacterium]